MRLRRQIVWLLASAALVLALCWVGPYGYWGAVGYWRGELFYKGLPASYWDRAVHRFAADYRGYGSPSARAHVDALLYACGCGRLSRWLGLSVTPAVLCSDAAAFPMLKVLARSHTEGVQACVAWELVGQRAPHDEAVAVLVNLLEDEDARTRSAALDSLSIFARQDDRAFAALKRARDDPSPVVRAQVAELLPGVEQLRMPPSRIGEKHEGGPENAP